jgi:hypothetical protein
MPKDGMSFHAPHNSPIAGWFRRTAEVIMERVLAANAIRKDPQLPYPSRSFVLPMQRFDFRLPPRPQRFAHLRDDLTLLGQGGAPFFGIAPHLFGRLAGLLVKLSDLLSHGAGILGSQASHFRRKPDLLGGLTGIFRRFTAALLLLATSFRAVSNLLGELALLLSFLPLLLGCTVRIGC